MTLPSSGNFPYFTSRCQRSALAQIIVCIAALLPSEPVMAATSEPKPVLRLETSETSKVVTFLSWDTEGTGREKQNLLRGDDGISMQFAAKGALAPLPFTPVSSSQATGGTGNWSSEYQSSAQPGIAFKIGHEDANVTMTLTNSDVQLNTTQSLTINIPFDPTVTPTVLIPSAWDDVNDVMILPAIVSAPDFGQMVLSASVAGVTAIMPGSRTAKITNLQLNVPVPAAGSSVTLTMTPLRLAPPAADIDPELWKLARRGWFNVFQPSSQWRNPGEQKSAPLGMLSNNVISDPVSFALWMYADQAMWQPELAPGISIMPSIRRTLEWWMDEKTSTTGEAIGYWDYYNFLDSNPSLIITAWDYVEGTSDTEWLKGRIEQLEFLSSYLEGRNIDEDGLIEATQKGNRNGLFEPDRSSCWWDAINCGHKDGYSNVVIYRAWRCLADLEKRLGRTEQQEKYTRLADGIKASYAKALLNPETGWLGWWRSEDGELHDYATPVVNGLAIEYGLIEPEQGKQILARLRKKMEEAGYKRYELGVPCFIVPVNRSDYLQPAGLGCPKQEDGKDSFGQYMNGGVSASPALHFLAAHYVAGEPGPADHILREMLKHLNAGKFQRGVTDEVPKGIDWADWNGNPTGYEGYLSDSFRFVQAILLRNENHRNRLYGPLYPKTR